MIELEKRAFNLRILLGLVVSAILLLLFQNCGGSFKAATTSFSSHLQKSGIDVCDDQLLSDYSQSFYKLSQTYNCGDCHNNSSHSPASFVDSDIDTAFDQFSKLGGAAVYNQKALSDHQDGYTGESMRGDLNVTKALWDEAIENFGQCVAQGGFEVSGSITAGKTTSLFDSSDNVIKIGKEEVLQWSLSETDFLPKLAGATFSITVSVEEDSSGDLEYHIKDPTLVAGSDNIYVENIDILLNGRKLGKTTYSFSEQVLSAHSRVTLSNTTAVFHPFAKEFLKADDQFSIHFHRIGIEN